MQTAPQTDSPQEAGPTLEQSAAVGTENAQAANAATLQQLMMIDFIMPPAKKLYDVVDDGLMSHFEYLDFNSVQSFTMSANSYGLEPCRWIADNVLKHCVNLKKVNFSDIFTTRARAVLPPSLKLLIEAIADKPIVELDLSANAFGPDGVKSFVSFLEDCPTLESLNVTNCGLGPEGGKMIAKAILKNDKMHLKEFYASRDRLENPGIQALSAVFAKHRTLQKIEVYQNGVRLGLSHLFKALLSCKGTIQHVDVNDNLIKRSTDELVDFIRTCTSVRYLNLSDCLIKKNE